MKLLIEGCRYGDSFLKDLLGEGFPLGGALDNNGKFRYVGYCWNDKLNDGVFFLPKVVIDEEGRVFGDYGLLPQDIADVGKSKLSERQREFLLEFAIRVYRALAVFKRGQTDQNVVIGSSSTSTVRGTKHDHETRLDIILALLEFQRRNRDFVVFTAKRCHSGFNKVNWTKTVTRQTPIFQLKSEPVYVQTENRKKAVDHEEELLVIFHSILHYIAKTWGFHVQFDLNYEPISGAQFQRYLNGYGAARLRAIKYRYFSDKLLELWELCYRFFEKMRSSRPTSAPSEYLFAKEFEVVFEAMIDELVGERNLPNGLKKLKEQRDGKRADHIFFGTSLYMAENCDNGRVCYIGDSKYYGIGNDVGDESIAKQFTYARNVIQENIDLHQESGNEEDKKRFPMLRDDVTEGYDTIPNFFISAKLPDESPFNFVKDDLRPRDFVGKHFSRQFKNRLFDRDTFHIAHFDVNFLYVIALYGRNSATEKEGWKSKVHAAIRKAIFDILNKRYSFYQLQLHDGTSDENAKGFIHRNFFELNGKVFSFPSIAAMNKRTYLLALEVLDLSIPSCLEDENSPFSASSLNLT